LTEGTPCVRFRDHGTSAGAPKSHCENTVFISVLTGLQPSECDWTIFYSSEQACGDETASSMFRRVGRAETKIASSEGALHTNSFYIVVLDERGAFDLLSGLTGSRPWQLLYAAVQ
jgi:hypothetical protein